MSNNDFNLYDGITLSEEQRKAIEISNIVSNIIIKLVKRRVELKLSQRDLASLSGIKQPMIARIEALDTIPRLDTLVKLANALNLEISLNNNSCVVIPRLEKNIISSIDAK